MDGARKKKVGAQCLIDDVERTMCRTSKKNQPPFSDSSEQLPQTMTLSSRGVGGSALLSPLHPRGLHKASALMYNISQPRSTINLRHLTRTKYAEDGEGPQQQIAVPLTKHYSAQAQRQSCTLTKRWLAVSAAVRQVPKLTSVVCNSKAQHIYIIIHCP